MEGFSPRNLKYMRAFAQASPDQPIVQQAAAQIPWFHNCVLLDKVKDQSKREWYVRQTIENGWSRNVLVHWIDSDLYERQGKASTNFARSMPRLPSDLARELLKDPYDFQFLATAREAEEREIERGLVAHMQEFSSSLGRVSRFSASSSSWKWAAKSFSSTCSSITSNFAVMSCWNSKLDPSNQSMPGR